MSLKHRGSENTEKDKRAGVSDELNALSYAVIGAAIEVHRDLGPGFLESAYEEAMAIELGLRNIAFERQLAVPLLYKGRYPLYKDHRLDFLIDKQLVLDTKATASIEPVFKTIVHSYLKATDTYLGLVINFNVQVLTQGVARVIRHDI